MKETTSQVFYLKPWTFPEVVQACVGYPLGQYSAITYVSLSRTLLSPIDPPEECEFWYLYKTYTMRVLQATVQTRHMSRTVPGTRSERCRVCRGHRTRPHLAELCHRGIPLRCVPRIFTPRSFLVSDQNHYPDCVRNGLEKAENFVRGQEFYDIFMEHSNTSATAGWLFEFRMHHLLRQGQTITIFPLIYCDTSWNVNCRTYIYKNYKVINTRALVGSRHLELPRLDEYPLNTEATVKIGRYYRPESATFPTNSQLSTLCSSSTPPPDGFILFSSCSKPPTTRHPTK